MCACVCMFDVHVMDLCESTILILVCVAKMVAVLGAPISLCDSVKNLILIPTAYPS